MSHLVAHCNNCRVLVYEPEVLTRENETEHRLPPLPESGLKGDFYAYCYVCRDWHPFFKVKALSDN